MIDGLRSNVVGLRPIRGLLVAVTVSRCAVMLYPFYGVYLAAGRHGLTVHAIALVVGMFGVGALVADIASGALAARVPEQRIAVVGLVGVVVIVLAISVTDELWTLVGLTALWGFCYELVNPIAYTLVARAMPESRRRFAFSAVRLAINLGMGIGPVLAGVLFTVSPGLLPWGTAIGYLAAAFILMRSRIARQETAEEGPAASTAVDVGEPARHGVRFWSFIAVTTPIHFAYALPTTAISVYVVHTLGKPVGWSSAVFAINALLIITCELVLNHAMLGLSRRVTLLVGYVCATVGFALAGLAAVHIWLLLAAAGVWTVGEMIVYPVMPDHISAISPARLKARNMGFYTAHFNLGVVFAPLVFLPLLDALGPVGSWSLVGVVLLIGLTATALISNMPGIWGFDEARPTTAAVVKT